MIVFGIETSCDETSIALIDARNRKVIAEEVFSQNHESFGGVYPEYASRNHLQILKPLIVDMMKRLSFSWKDVDLIAFTGGPGLIGGLMIGTMVAKSLSMVTGIPMVAVNHLEGHALMPTMFEDIQYPFLLLLISGGHCQILLVQEIGQYIIIGDTLDDSVGECFDKVARSMGFRYPGGPKIEQCALSGDRKLIDFPKPLLKKSKYNFSFSGLKTAVINTIHSDKYKKEDICASFEFTVATVLLNRLNNALKHYKTQDVVISGGVAANQYVRHMLNSNIGIKCTYPPIRYCTDNAVMIAWAGYLHHKNICDLNFIPRARWPLCEYQM